MNSNQPTILLIGHGSRDAAAIAEYHEFAAELQTHSGLNVQACFLEFADPSIAESLRVLVENEDVTDIVALPLFLGPAGHQKNDVPTTINWAKKQYPHVTFRYGAPIGAHYGIVRTLADRADAALAAADPSITNEDTALLVVGRGSRDPDSNSEVVKASRMLWEGRTYGWVETCFYALTDPNIAEGIERCHRLGAKRVVIVPYLLFTGRILQRTHEHVDAVRENYSEMEIIFSEHLGAHPETLAAVLQRYEEAHTGVASMTCDLCKYRHKTAGFENEFGMSQSSDHHHGMRGVHTHGLTEQLNALLPPRYQDIKVSFAPMDGAAGLLYDDAGQVAWDQIWEGFCDLALAGGPPHRGDLLEPVTAAEANAQPQAYQQVLSELKRGIEMITKLPVVTSSVPGWIGMVCDNEEMAVWLLRAIIVENVMVRREGAALYLPAGPGFRLEEEIKNVITVIAKTHHYWMEHMATQAAPNG